MASIAIERESPMKIEEKVQQKSDVSVINPISKKVCKILESKIETDKEIMDALQTVSTFFVDNTLHNRRNLRRDLEQCSLQVNLEFLESFKEVKAKLDKVSSAISAMNTCCNDMTARLEATKSQTRDLINETTKLQLATKKIEKRSAVASAFLSIFQLKPDELKAFKLAQDGVVTKEFFNALNRAKEIHGDCKQLLLTGQHTAGLEIMDAMATHQESAYEMLYRWVQKECNTFNADTNEINDLICHAFSALESRPVLFKYSLDECCIVRRNYVIRSFINALTKGGPSGIPKPIELLSHDPLRYISDMLAWIHQALASEKEFVQTLLKDCTNDGVSQHVNGALSQITEGLARPLKVRVEQVLGGENGPVVLYKLSNLFRFYHTTIKPSLDESSSLMETLKDLCEFLSSLFQTSLVTSLNRLLEKLEPPTSEMVPVQGLHQVMLLLRDVLESHDIVLSPTLDKKDSFKKIFAVIIDPLLNALILTCTELNPVHLAVYMLNCLHLIYSVLSLYEYTEERLEMLQAQMDVHIGVLISEQAGYILQRAGCSTIYQLFLQHHQNQGPASKLLNLDDLSLKIALEKFDLFLASPDSYKLPQCRFLSSSKLKRTIDSETMTSIISVYKLIFDKISDPKNAYKESTMVICKDAKEIEQLLSRF